MKPNRRDVAPTGGGPSNRVVGKFGGGIEAHQRLGQAAETNAYNFV